MYFYIVTNIFSNLKSLVHMHKFLRVDSERTVLYKIIIIITVYQNALL